MSLSLTGEYNQHISIYSYCTCSSIGIAEYSINRNVPIVIYYYVPLIFLVIANLALLSEYN